MTTATDTTATTRPYGFHSNCDHDASKKARRQCRNKTRDYLAAEKVDTLTTIARTVDLPRRSNARKDDLVYRLSARPAVRETFAPFL